MTEEILDLILLVISSSQKTSHLWIDLPAQQEIAMPWKENVPSE